MIAPPNVLRAARELLGLKQVEAAQAAGISRRTIQRLETGELDRTRASILLQTCYEDHGIMFVRPASGLGWGLIDNSQASKAGQHELTKSSM
ncbi:helix-turn-helix domain-containing protein [Rhizobium rhizolycopersici]|uniref:Helix-turn-helix transcriptional regulator n=1 Tax=Mycoplana rhizolycopersici TaxID=2746702 RepID=A0ABX2QIR2_9HYPH|nr:helix-turn-helix transcriptional regulator [Rhizobium rhizolycopersici]